MKEDGEHAKLSVYTLFCELFPEIASARGNLLRPALVFQVVRILFLAGNNKILRLHFNKIGYQVYEKEQSRRVFILTHSIHFLRQNLLDKFRIEYVCVTLPMILQVPALRAKPGNPGAPALMSLQPDVSSAAQ